MLIISYGFPQKKEKMWIMSRNIEKCNVNLILSKKTWNPCVSVEKRHVSLENTGIYKFLKGE
jgi:phage major head subunit gpT-like protein